MDNLGSFNQWKYHQKQSMSGIKRITLLTIINIPLGYLELIIYLFFLILTFPLMIKRGLKYWLDMGLIRELNPEDVSKLGLNRVSNAVVDQQIKNINFSLDALSKTATFLRA